MPAQGEYGIIELKDHFCGPEIPVAGTGAYAAAGAEGHFIGPFRVTGDLAEDDTGVVGIDKAGGWIRISGNDEDGKGIFIGTGVVLSPALNGTLVLETRLEMAALTTRNVFVGFMDVNADDVAEPITATGTTLTLTLGSGAGWLLDSQLTSATEWHMPYKGGTTTGPTASNDVDSDVVAVAAEADILRIEIDTNGTARWYINGDLKQTVEGAVSTTTLLAAGVGCWGTTTTAADADLDYLLVRAYTDWTR